jgi:hypothetical protein
MGGELERNLCSSESEMHVWQIRIAALISLMTSLDAIAQSTAQYSTGGVLIDHADYLALPVAPLPTSGQLPEAASLEKYFPTPGHQGQVGACAAWAMTYEKAYRIYTSMARPTTPDATRQSPEFIFSALTSGRCQGGIALPNALRFMKSVGSVSWDELPYSDSRCDDWRSVTASAQNKSSSSYRLSSDGDALVDDLRNNIVSGNPVILAIEVCPEFYTPNQGRILEAKSGVCSAHAVLGVGYDDTIGAVRILNSWGTGWGDNGLAWMDYSVFKQRVREAYVDFGPAVAEDVSWISDPQAVVSTKPPQISSDQLRQGLRTYFGKHLGVTIVGGQQVNLNQWGIWLNLPPSIISQIKSVDYHFDHPSFRSDKHSVSGSNVFFATWTGYGCVDNDTSRMTVHLKTSGAKDITVNFNHCKIEASREM